MAELLAAKGTLPFTDAESTDERPVAVGLLQGDCDETRSSGGVTMIPN
jgi:hypothetical protein